MESFFIKVLKSPRSYDFLKQIELDYIVHNMKKFQESPQQSMINQIVPICKLLLVNPATIVAGKGPETYLLSTMTVSARNVFRYLYSIFMSAAFLLIFVFAPLVLFFGSLVFHYPRSFVLRVRIFLHIVYLASL